MTDTTADTPRGPQDHGPKPRLGLALGSGGARGWCHIGVLRTLDQMDVRPDVVAGCSMGALVGAAWAAGCLGALEDWARGLTRARFLRHIDLRLEGGGLVAGDAIAEVFHDLGLPERIEDLDHPFMAVTTDMASGREVWLAEGDLHEAIRASIAIPGVFPPRQIRGRWLLDGGLINPVPTSACRALGADVTIAVNPNAKGDGPLWAPEMEGDFWHRLGGDQLRSYLPDSLQGLWPQGRQEPGEPAMMDVVSTSIDILTEFLRKARHAADPPHVLLEADLNHMSVMEMFRAGEAIDEGARIARAARAQVQRAMQGTAP